MIAFLVCAAVAAAAYISFRYSPLKALLDVYLPCLLFWPIHYGWFFHGVVWCLQYAVSVPILLAVVLRSRTRWSWRLTDALLLATLAESYYSLLRQTTDTSLTGALTAFYGLGMVPTYVFGRYLLDTPEARDAFVKRFLFLLSITSVLCIYEYRMAANPFEAWGSRIANSPNLFVQQLRWGFARVGGPFGHAIIAGIVFFSGLLLQFWFASRGKWEAKFRGLAWLPGKKSTYITLGMLGGLWMTQSRGPWMGGALGLLLFLAGRAKNVRRGLVRAALLSAAVLIVFYAVTNKYTAADDGHMDMDRQNAVYRRELLTNYIPIVETGGLYGYGLVYPTVGGQDSIDNQYLLTALHFGYVGLGLQVSVILLAVARLVGVAWNAGSREDATFALCLLGIVVGIAATITTVFLGWASYSLFFLVLGWAQSIRSRQAAALPVEGASSETQARFAFRRVFN